MRAFAQKPKATQQTRPAESAKAGPALSGERRDAHSILQLQGAIGNQAVRRFLGTNQKLQRACSCGGTCEKCKAGDEASIRRTTLQGTVQRDETGGGQVRVIAKDNGRVGVVLVRGGVIVQGYAEIVPPPGMSAADAANQIQTRVSGTGPIPKVDVIVPPGWGRQPVNPDAPVQVMDTNAVERERLEAQRQAKVDEMRELYQQYQSDFEFQYDKFGTTLPPSGPTNLKSDDEIMALAGSDNFFFEWMQRRRAKSDWENFQKQARAMGHTDPEGIKEMWKQYRQPELQAVQQGEKQLHDLKQDPENALQQRYAEPLLLSWVASNPKPVEVPGDDGKAKMYVLPLPNGSMATLNEAQYAKLLEVAKAKIETQLNMIQNRKGLYQSHKEDRGLASRGMDAMFGAELEGKTWAGIDKSVQAARDALEKGDLKSSLAHIEEAEKQSGVARKEWDRYLHARDVGGEVTIQGLEYIKKGSELALAVGTIPMGGTGLLILTGKGVTETMLLAAAQEAGGQHVDWKDLGFDVGVQVVSGLALHGFGKLQALGPKNAIMNAFRESFGAQLTADVVQSVLIDSASYAARQAYQEARGRDVKFTAKDFMDHLVKYLTDPTGLPLEIIQGALARHYGGRGIPVDAPAAKGAPSKAKHPADGPDAPSKSGSGANAADIVKRPPVEEAAKIKELVQDKKNVNEVTDAELVKDYDVEISVQVSGESHTYRRKRSDGSWCRFSKRSCGLKLNPEDDAAVQKAAPEALPKPAPEAGKAPDPAKPAELGPADQKSTAAQNEPKEAQPRKEVVKAVDADPDGVTAASPPDPVRDAKLAQLEAKKASLEAEIQEVQARQQKLQAYAEELAKQPDAKAAQKYIEKIQPELDQIKDFDHPPNRKQAIDTLTAERHELTKQVLEQRYAELDLINEALSPKTGLLHRAHTTHSISGVAYDAQGFPVFKHTWETSLTPDLHQSSDGAQFLFCNKALDRAIAANPGLGRQFTPAQLQQIAAGENPQGYTWHHHQDKGRMQLIPSDQHGQTPHVGGASIWGGRTERRQASQERKKQRNEK